MIQRSFDNAILYINIDTGNGNETYDWPFSPDVAGAPSQPKRDPSSTAVPECCIMLELQPCALALDVAGGLLWCFLPPHISAEMSSATASGYGCGALDLSLILARRASP